MISSQTRWPLDQRGGPNVPIPHKNFRLSISTTVTLETSNRFAALHRNAQPSPHSASWATPAFQAEKKSRKVWNGYSLKNWELKDTKKGEYISSRRVNLTLLVYIFIVSRNFWDPASFISFIVNNKMAINFYNLSKYFPFLMLSLMEYIRI